MQLPPDLLAALDAELARVPGRDLASAVRRLSDRYRSGHARDASPFLQGERDVLAYAAYRLPATYAAIAAALTEVRRAQPAFRPTSLLDAGGGPGTAAWAALGIWPGIERVTVLERDEGMIRLGKTLSADAVADALRAARWQHGDLTTSWQVQPADLTVAAYVLGEIPPDARAGLVERLWQHTSGTCVLVEPGTPRGYELVREATEMLAASGAEIVAPAPVGWTCVESESDWCHFSIRVPRTRLHRLAKESTLSYEDEKFAYVAASRLPGEPLAARVIRQPQVRSGHVRLVLCTAQGVRHVVVTRSSRDAYHLAKELTWGSAVSDADAAMLGLDR